MPHTGTLPLFPTNADREPELLELILAALEATRRIPPFRPRTGLAEHFNRDNLADFYLEEISGGWAANIVFRHVPPGQPNTLGTPDDRPHASARDAFLEGASILCGIVTGSPELPFTLAGDDLVVTAFGA